MICYYILLLITVGQTADAFYDPMTVSLDDLVIPFIDAVKYLRVICFELHIKEVDLRNMAKIWPALSSWIRAFIFSRLDYCNALLGDLPKRSVQSLQIAQNAAAHLLAGTGKFEHVWTQYTCDAFTLLASSSGWTRF